jgi:hypothetical protein
MRRHLASVSSVAHRERLLQHFSDARGPRRARMIGHEFATAA